MPHNEGKNNCVKIQSRTGAMTKPSWAYSVFLPIQQFLTALRTPYICSATWSCRRDKFTLPTEHNDKVCIMIEQPLSEEIAHPTVYHLSQLSVDIQLAGLIKCREDSGDFPFSQLDIT